MIINIFKFSKVRYYIFCEFANYIYKIRDDDTTLLKIDNWKILCFEQLNKSGLSV
mgnify:CR=1 FL=1